MFLAPLARLVLPSLALVAGTWVAPAASREGEAGRAAAPVAIAAQIVPEGGTTRVVFTLSKSVEARAFVMERPDRVIVDLPEVNFQLPDDVGRRREGLVASFRYGLFAAGRSRVVIDLAQPALVTEAGVSVRASDGAHLLTVELARADREAFRRKAASDEAALAATAAPVATKGKETSADRRPLVVIDPGHGGIDPGARAAGGLFEKDIVFAFAQRLRQKLEASGRYRVAMTREADVFVELAERVRLSRHAKADLFISIHADSISAAPQVRGLTVYTGAERASDAESAVLVERENKADGAGGLDTRDRPEAVTDILQDLTTRETRSFSHRLAKRVIGQVKSVVRLNQNPQREAGFVVLRAPDVPSILVELGYLSSRKDIDLLMSSEWRDRSTSAMTVAIDQYFATRVAIGGIAPVSP